MIARLRNLVGVYRVLQEARGVRSPSLPGDELDIPTALTKAEQQRVAELARGGLVLEIGAQQGASTVVMGREARLLHSVDWHRGDPNAGEGETLVPYWRNLIRYGVRDKVVAHVGDVADVLPAFERDYFDGAFVDGFHEEDAVRKDIELVRPVVKAGGWLAFHDYGRFGVTAAVDELAAELRLNPEIVGSIAVVRV